jgi:REP element-mobilizing transposase RayT
MPPPATIRTRGYLPHWEQDHATYFVTFRLADSLPNDFVDQAQRQRRRIAAAQNAGTATQADLADLRKLLRKTERSLDAGQGDAHMLDRRIAGIVFESVTHFNEHRYRLYAACVMPNHVHAVFSPVAPSALASILHSWKSHTAHEANLVLGRHGHFWQHEYFDHLVRNSQSFARIVRYVTENPARAGLRDWPRVWPSRQDIQPKLANKQPSAATHS